MKIPVFVLSLLFLALLFISCSQPVRVSRESRVTSGRRAESVHFRDSRWGADRYDYLPLSFSTTDTSLFGFQLINDPDGNEVACWGWNPSRASDTSKPSAYFSLERNYKGLFEWNFDIVSTEGKNRRAMHSMINRKDGRGRILSFAFDRMDLWSGNRNAGDSEGEPYASFAISGIRLNKALVLKNLVVKVEEEIQPYRIDWRKGNIFTFDFGSADSCAFEFIHSKTGQMIRVVINAEQKQFLEWPAASGSVPLVWPGGKEVKVIGPDEYSVMFTFIRVREHEDEDIIIAQALRNLNPADGGE